jgi:hypothetical protein
MDRRKQGSPYEKYHSRRDIMKLNWISIFLAVVLVIFTLSPAVAQTEIVPSGFLDDYNILKPNAEGKGDYNYRKEGVSISKYPNVMIEPVEIWLDPESTYKGLSPDVLKEMTEEFRNIMIQNLVGTVNWVFEPGEGVMSLRIAITNVYAKKPKKNFLSYTPIGLIAGGVKKAAGTNYSLTNAVMESELRDSVTGELLGALMATQFGKVEGKKKDKVTWDEITDDFTAISLRLKSVLQETLEQ